MTRKNSVVRNKWHLLVLSLSRSCFGSRVVVASWVVVSRRYNLTTDFLVLWLGTLCDRSLWCSLSLRCYKWTNWSKQPMMMCSLPLNHSFLQWSPLKFLWCGVKGTPTHKPRITGNWGMLSWGEIVFLRHEPPCCYLTLTGQPWNCIHTNNAGWTEQVVFIDLWLCAC